LPIFLDRHCFTHAINIVGVGGRGSIRAIR
jgi:hypothetical protein